MNTNEGTQISSLKPFVTKTGTANKGAIAPSLGKVDISTSEKAYRFQVALAGVCGRQSDIKCSIRDDGKVKIEGLVTVTYLHDADLCYEVKMQELSPPGQFSIFFNLPGPVDPRLTLLNYELGILEATVMKFRIPYFRNNNH